MQVLTKEEERILKEGYEALIEKLGLVGFVRFVRLMGWGRGNWTEERHEILEELNKKLVNMTPEEVVKFFREGGGPGNVHQSV
jgi:hypothetical protein